MRGPTRLVIVTLPFLLFVCGSSLGGLAIAPDQDAKCTQAQRREPSASVGPVTLPHFSLGSLPSVPPAELAAAAESPITAWASHQILTIVVGLICMFVIFPLTIEVVSLRKGLRTRSFVCLYCAREVTLRSDFTQGLSTPSGSIHSHRSQTHRVIVRIRLVRLKLRRLVLRLSWWWRTTAGS